MDDTELETLWERIREAMRLGTESGMAIVTLELRDAETLWSMAEQAS